MKKKIALLLGALLLLTGIFTACSNTAATTRIARWEVGETYTFNINLADFNTAEDRTTLFNSYDVKITNQDASETTLKCYKDSVVQMSTAVSPAGGTDTETSILTTTDQIRPIDAKGTFKMSILSDTPSTNKLVTEQVIYSQYEIATLTQLGCLGIFENSKYDVTDSQENPFENNNGRITLISKTTSTVIFGSNANQVPTSSVKENEGFYIGKIAQEPSDYKYETTYDFENRKATVKKNDGEEEVRKLGVAKGSACLDASQLLLYIRSLDKSAAAFQDSPSVAVYDPVTNSLVSAVFALNRDFYAVLNNNGKNFASAVHSVSVSVDSRPFMTQYSLPDISSEGGGLDFLPQGAADKLCKFTTIKFRSGWYSYEIDQYDQQVLSAIDLQKKTAK